MGKLCSSVGNEPSSTSAMYSRTASRICAPEDGEALRVPQRSLVVVDAEHVVEHLHLAVAVRPRADADGRDRKPLA